MLRVGRSLADIKLGVLGPISSRTVQSEILTGYISFDPLCVSPTGGSGGGRVLNDRGPIKTEKSLAFSPLLVAAPVVNAKFLSVLELLLNVSECTLQLNIPCIL